MKHFSPIFLAAVMAATPALAQTVNDFTLAEQARAEAAIRAAGFVPRGITMAQDHNLFFRAEKEGRTYFITVTSQGQVYPSLPLSQPGA